MQINIGHCINDSYSQHLGILMQSILTNASADDTYKFFIVTDFISDENKAKFEQLKSIKDFELEYINVKRSDFEVIQGCNLDISVFYRFVLFGLQSVDKLLYLDADMICRHDLAELFAIDVGDKAMAAAEDIMGKKMKATYELSPTTTYINSGVLLLNLEQTRDVDLMAAVQNLPDVFRREAYGDQDVINYVFQDRILPIDIRWNYCFPFGTTYDDINYYISLNKDPYILHWITNVKPWRPGIRVPHMQEEYFNYFRKSPWYNEEFWTKYIVDSNTAILNALLKISQAIGVES